MAAALAPEKVPRDDPAKDDPEEDDPADLRTFCRRKRATAPAAPRRREMAAAMAPQEALYNDPVEDDPVKEDPVEDDLVEDDPIEDDPVEEVLRILKVGVFRENMLSLED